METVELQVEARAGRGKGAGRKLRAAGRIPAVLYGRGKSGESLSCTADDFVEAMGGPLGRNTRFRLVGGGEGLEGRLAIAREIQKRPVGRDVLHVDFYELDPEATVVVRVPVLLVGAPEGVQEGGILRQLRRDVDVRCTPGNIPESLELDVTGLKLGQALSVSDVDAGEGVEIFYRHDFALCGVMTPRGLEEEEAEAEVELAEGEEAEGEDEAPEEEE